VLAGASLGDDLGLAQPLGKQQLAEGVVDLVAARVVEVLSLKPDVCASGVLSQPLSHVQARRPAHVIVV